MTDTGTLEALRRLDYLLRFKWTCGYQDASLACPENGKPHAGHPYKHARNNQVAPNGEWYIWFLMSGRGFGKTRTGAEYVKKYALENPKSRIAIVAPTFAKGRDACVEGESGLLGKYDGEGCIPWEKIERWNRSIGEIDLKNGSQIKIFSAEDEKTADLIRGYQCHLAWMEELAACAAQDHAWKMLEFANRLGDNPRVIITSTPRPTPLIKKLVKDEECIVTVGSTFDNAENLAERQLTRLKRNYEGTTLGRQELYGELLNSAVGALWRTDQIVHDTKVPQLLRVVIAVDPAGSHKEDSDQTGIVVAGIDELGRAWVLLDASGRYGPEQWAQKVADLYDEYNADAVVAERNYGGEMVRSNLKANGGSRLPISTVHTRIGKKRRAEPVVHLYDRGIVLHAGTFKAMEEQMTEWVPKGQFDEDGEQIVPSSYSPDRMDALVYAITELLLKPKASRGGMSFHE